MSNIGKKTGLNLKSFLEIDISFLERQIRYPSTSTSWYHQEREKKIQGREKIENLGSISRDHTYQEKVFCFGSTHSHIWNSTRYLQERDNMHLQVVNYILYGKPIYGISNTTIQLARTCLVLSWYQKKKKIFYRKYPCFLYGSKDKW